MKSILAILITILLSQNCMALNGKHFDRVITVIFENKDYSQAIGQPFFKYLADQGAHFSNFLALTHPSQGNYIALTSGSVNGVVDNDNVDLNVSNIVDLLEAKGTTWKVYAEDFPGDCFTGKVYKTYVRKHNPFISYLNIQQNPARCSRIVNADAFDQDAAKGTLPNYVFYVPDMNNDGHDTGVKFADWWFEKKFSKSVHDDRFMENTVLVSTFDESRTGAINQIYTSIYGRAVKSGIYPQKLNTYSLLALVEQNWDLGDLGRDDVNAPRIPNIWK
jgi:Phosphoesterase family